MALLDPDFHGLLQVKEVPVLQQARLSVARVRSISRLSSIADDRATVRNFCRDSLALDLANDIVDVAAMVDAWESCSTRVSVKNKAEAEASVASIPRAVNKVEIHDLLARYENLHEVKLEDKVTPASATLRA